MTTVVVSPHNVTSSPGVGGHIWVYMQYVQGLRELGCDVWWLERYDGRPERPSNSSDLAASVDRLHRFGLRGKVTFYQSLGTGGDPLAAPPGVVMGHRGAEEITRRADLLLNFDCGIDPGLLSRFPRKAFVDIDPGLLQLWVDGGQLTLPAHDLYFTTGETVGTASALFGDCGLPWIHIHPPVSLSLWPYVEDAGGPAFTTVSSWWADEWITGDSGVYENNKRVSFLRYAPLAGLTRQPLELALYLGEGDKDDERRLRRHGWRVLQSRQVAATPQMYRRYIQRSRGEFSCAKPSCMKLSNAWISDRTLCYLASGRPAVVEHTGPSGYLPDGEGLLRFSSMTQALEALTAVNADYERHRRAAREIVETYFDARQVLQRVLSFLS